jgi:hypothetical protein
VNYDSLTDSDVHDGVRNLDTEVSTLERENKIPLMAKLDDLQRSEIEHMGLPASTDPTLAQGMVVITTMPCTLEQVEAIIVGDDFGQQFPNVYDSYTRNYTTSIDDYLSRKTNTVSWITTYQATLLGDRYTAEVKGEARWVPADEGDVPNGPVLIDRAVLMKPGVFEGSSSKSFLQDYQVDVFYERAPGLVVHMFAVWRQMNVGTFSTDDDMLINISLANFVQWDQDMSKLCGQSPP